MDNSTPPKRKKQTGTQESGRDALTQDALDEALWMLETEDVERMSRGLDPQRGRGEIKQIDGLISEPFPAEYEVKTSRETKSSNRSAGFKKKPAQSGASEIDSRTAEKIRRGKMNVEASLDLHGMSRIAAEDALRMFIPNCRARGLRLVLVITGKGGSSADPLKRGGGVLRQSVPDWLREPPLAPDVLYVTEAKPKDGGSGALYVYLKRDRG